MFKIDNEKRGNRAVGVLMMSCALCGLILAYAITGIYFLAVDHYKGGECALTSGYQVWIYCLMYFVIGPVMSVVIQGCAAMTNRAIGAFGFLVLSAFFVIYGSIVLFFPGPCDEFKETGLWVWAEVAFSVQCVVYAFVLGALVYFINTPIQAPKTEEHAPLAAQYDRAPLASQYDRA